MIARDTRVAVADLGGMFLYGPHCYAEEERLGLPRGTSYFRGRSAVLGNPAPGAVVALFGIFPAWMVDIALSPPVCDLPQDEAIDLYLTGCWSWWAAHLPHGDERLAELIERVVDNADDRGLALFAGWRRVPRPASGPERLGHALMVLRELRGGLHFAALRANGVRILQAVAINPLHGRPHLIRVGWQPDEADKIVAQVTPELSQRWHQAEFLTNSALELAFDVLDDVEKIELRDLLACLRSRFGQVRP